MDRPTDIVTFRSSIAAKYLQISSNSLIKSFFFIEALLDSQALYSLNSIGLTLIKSMLEKKLFSKLKTESKLQFISLS